MKVILIWISFVSPMVNLMLDLSRDFFYKWQGYNDEQSGNSVFGVDYQVREHFTQQHPSSDYCKSPNEAWNSIKN